VLVMADVRLLPDWRRMARTAGDDALIEELPDDAGVEEESRLVAALDVALERARGLLVEFVDERKRTP
jgi:hypothetical protein